LLSPAQEVIHDYHAQGLSLRGHPLASLRSSLTAQRVVTAVELRTLEAERNYRVAGLVLLRQRPSTANGVTFMTIEDETGTVNLIIWRQVWERFHRVARQAPVIIATGFLQRQDGVIHLVVQALKDISPLLADVGQASRDFR
jgi:error-prone DNA polymerase